MSGVPEDVAKILIPMVEEFEGRYAHRYDDGTGVTTIGIGFVASDFGDIQNMPESMTEAQMDAKLIQLLNESYYPPVAALNQQLGGWMNVNMLAATADFVYNLGDGDLATTHTFGHYLHQKNKQAAADSMLEYSMPGTPVHEGLLRRREAERTLFLKPYTPPDPYLIYLDETFGPHKLNERAFAKEVDGWLEHPNIHHIKLKNNHANVVFFRQRIWIVSVFEPPEFKVKRKEADWSDHRGARYQGWDKRAKAVEKAIG